jgi:hypothetical protein
MHASSWGVGYTNRTTGKTTGHPVVPEVLGCPVLLS